MLQASLAGLVESVRDGVILIDRQRRIVAVNPAASDMLEMPAAGLIGEELTAALPSLGDSLVSHHIARLLGHRERFSGDLPGLLRPRQWLHVDLVPAPVGGAIRSEEHTSELQSLMRISYAVFCLNKKRNEQT